MSVSATPLYVCVCDFAALPSSISESVYEPEIGFNSSSVMAYTHTYIHTYTQTYIHTYIHTYIYTYIHIHIHTHTGTYEGRRI